jgi:hypothetical protein
MKLTIWSHFEGQTWEGEIPDGEASEPLFGGTITTDRDAVLEYVFRLFNRVQQEDVERLDALGYELPSLSTGDRVTLPDGSVWHCASIGWEQVT